MALSRQILLNSINASSYVGGTNQQQQNQHQFQQQQYHRTSSSTTTPTTTTNIFHHNHHQLRKQKSTNDLFFNQNTSNNNNNRNSRRSNLQKQLSIDQSALNAYRNQHQTNNNNNVIGLIKGGQLNTNSGGVNNINNNNTNNHKNNKKNNVKNNKIINNNDDDKNNWLNFSGDCSNNNKCEIYLKNAITNRAASCENNNVQLKSNDSNKKPIQNRGAGDDRININIFLSHNLADGHGAGSAVSENLNCNNENLSDNESPRNCSINGNNSDNNNNNNNNNTNQMMNKENHQIIDEQDLQKKNPIVDVVQVSTELRRLHFHNSRALTIANNSSNNNNNNDNNNQNNAGDRPIHHQRRPPLIRAMSAPIRPIDDTVKLLQQQGKRRVRRKRLDKDKDDIRTICNVINNNNNQNINKTRSNNNIDLIDRNKINNDNNNEEIINNNNIQLIKQRPKSHTNSNKISQNNTFSGCDIVTLVSLLSSGGSDSEREDNKNDTNINETINIINNNRRAPMLRKTGKSVSFQEHEEFSSLSSGSSKEFPIMLRRGSIAPLAARIRANRPPTAPPGSIFLKNCDSNISENMPLRIQNNTIKDKKNNIKSISSNNSSVDNLIIDDNSTGISSSSSSTSPTSTTSSSISTSSSSSSTTITDEEYPEYVSTIKEKECWKLFRKMLNKGVTVSFETILRGMLTPTEIRAVQDKKPKENVQNNDDDDVAEKQHRV